MCEHEASYGGNCDITCNFQNKYLWLAEAKIDYDNGHIMQGFRQLVDRYITSSEIQKEGALVIYCKDKVTHEVLTGWKKYFFDKDNKHNEYSINFDSDGSNYFITSHFHKATSKNLKIKHIVVSLFDGATDKSAMKKKNCSHSCVKCCPAIKPKKPK